MKTAFQMSLLLATVLFTACREESKSEPSKKPTIAQVRFSPAEGERWVYKVEVGLDPGAQIPAGIADVGPEGVSSDYRKERVYLGLKPVEAESKEMAHCFEVFKGGRKQELEFSLINEEGILTRAWQEAGKERILMPPVLLVPAKLSPGSIWEMNLPNPNDPGGVPMFYRQFRYFGLEEIQVMGQSRHAHRVKIFGKTGQLELQRDFWFVDQLGIVKERKAYYAQEKRLVLVEETLIEHRVPEQ